MTTAPQRSSPPAPSGAAAGAELPKTYDPSNVEADAYRLWTEARAFHAEPTDPGDPYSIVIPPPNVTAALHLGHALNNTIQDVLIRHHRMRGDNTCWLPGTDHAGIATQTIVEKRVMQEEGKRRIDFSRDAFVDKIQAWKDQYEQKITEQLKAMGCSCDWERQAFTMDPIRARAVREAFFRLFKDGLIYRGKRLVNWDPATQTALADDEVEMEEVDGRFYYLRYPLSDGSGHITVATTRPETMLGDTAVAVNPKDPRAAGLVGKSVRLPIVNRNIPIIADEYVVLSVEHGGDPADVKAQFASGFLKVTPAHDPNDYDLGRRHDLELINVMAPDATISAAHGWPAEDAARADPVLRQSLLGQSREEARKRIVQWFKENGLLEETRPYRHSVGHSYRSHVPIEPYLSDQWYCKVTDPRLAGAALRALSPDQRDDTEKRRERERVGSAPFAVPLPDGRGSLEGAVANSEKSRERERAGDGRGAAAEGGGGSGWEGGLRFYPARYARTFQAWHENIRDWCISRQLWWGHRIPVWSKAGRHEWPGGEDRAGFYDAAQDRTYLCLRQGDPDAGIVGEGWEQDPDVLDTWFSSALWPISTLGWPADNPALGKWNPSNVLTTAREIITLWVSRMVMFNLYFRGCLPFRDVFIHAMIQDGEGQKMSKTLGNGVDPLDIIGLHGADAMRYTLAAMTTHTQDLRMPVELVDPHSGQVFTPKKITLPNGYVVAAPVQESPADASKKLVSSFGYASGQAAVTADLPLAKNTSAKFDLGRNFCNKIWNAVRFALMNLGGGIPQAPVDEQKWSLADRWIVSRFNRTVAECDAALAEYRFDVYAKACYDFFWRDLCDWHLESIKPAMRDPARAPQTANVLASVLDGAMRLLHPLVPFITETIWRQLNAARPNRGLPGRLQCPPSELLVRAAWPRVGEFAEAAEFIFPKVQEIIGAIRQLRNDHNVKPGQPVTASVMAPGDAARSLEANRELVELLATCELKVLGPDAPPPPAAARAAAAGCEIHVEGLVDEAAEAGRVAKEREKLTKQITALRTRLANDAYTAKAPPHLVQQTRDQLAAAEAELVKLTST